MSGFTLHTRESAPEGSRLTLSGAEKNFGFVPNLLGIFAESPAALKGYLALAGQIEQSSFTATEAQVVLLSASFENDCTYCVAGHSAIALGQGVPADVVAALRDGTPLPARLEALRYFTRSVVRKRGHLEPGELETFLAAGFTKGQVLEVILGVAMKTLSNYTNHITETPLDAAFQDHAWSKPVAQI